MQYFIFVSKNDKIIVNNNSAVCPDLDIDN